MPTATAKSETIRIRIEPEKKRRLDALYKERGMSVSQAVRQFLDEELAGSADPLDVFDAIMASADKKLQRYGAPEPSIDDIVSFVERSRAERASLEARTV